MKRQYVRIVTALIDFPDCPSGHSVLTPAKRLKSNQIKTSDGTSRFSRSERVCGFLLLENHPASCFEIKQKL